MSMVPPSSSLYSTFSTFTYFNSLTSINTKSQQKRDYFKMPIHTSCIQRKHSISITFVYQMTRITCIPHVSTRVLTQHHQQFLFTITPSLCTMLNKFIHSIKFYKCFFMVVLLQRSRVDRRQMGRFGSLLVVGRD